MTQRISDLARDWIGIIRTGHVAKEISQTTPTCCLPDTNEFLSAVNASICLLPEFTSYMRECNADRAYKCDLEISIEEITIISDECSTLEAYYYLTLYKSECELN